MESIGDKPMKIFKRIVNSFMKKMKGENKKEAIPKSLIATYLPSNPTIVEAGAHIGVDTAQMSKLWPKGTIHAFEPIPELFSQLQRNTSKRKNVCCYPMALGNQTGTAKIFVSSGRSDASSSLLPPKEHLTYHPDILFETEIQVPTITLDKWAEEQGINKIDFLWLDLQGYELAVLKAAPHVLETVQAIYTEVNLDDTYAGVSLYPEMRQWLEVRGFKVIREDLPWQDAGNVFFAKDRL
jgi:FkbM family methyltransferase